jgi:16S rRNA (uracil1498-N3)-methyltransferase
MARRRFLVDQVHDRTAEIRGEDAHHLARVLRAEPGQQYEISDGAAVYLAEISAVGKDHVSFRVVEQVDTPPSPVHLTILAALTKFDRFEWLIEKATELGAAVIAPVNATRSEKGLYAAAAKRVERWRRIARESSQQSRRLRPPEIQEPQELGAAFAALAGESFFLDEKPGCPPLLTILPPRERRLITDSVALATGPEGGWTDAERAVAASAGWKPVSLGPLVLRAETAAITAAGLLIHAWWASQIE